MVTGQVMRTPVWGWSLPGPAATTSPSVGLSLDFFGVDCLCDGNGIYVSTRTIL